MFFLSRLGIIGISKKVGTCSHSMDRAGTCSVGLRAFRDGTERPRCHTWRPWPPGEACLEDGHFVGV